MKTLLAFLLCFQTVFFFINSQTSQKDWWYTSYSYSKSCKKAHECGLRDTLLSLFESEYHVWFPVKFDTTRPTLIFIHGMGMNGIGQWTGQLSDFSKHYNLIVPDLVGYAMSSQKNNDYSPEIQARVLHESLQRISVLGSVNLVGFSYGGLVVATYHYLYPTETHKIAVCDAPVKFFTQTMVDSIVKSRDLVHFDRLISPTNKHETNQFFDAILGAKAPPLSNRLRNKVIQNIFQVNAETKRKQMDYMSENASVYTQLNYQFNTSSVLFLWGAKDGVIPISVGKQLHKEYPLASWVVIEKAKHDALMTYKKEFNAALLQFFKDQ